MRTFEQLKEIFPDVVPTEWHTHPNGNGWVKNTVTIADKIYIGEDAIVSDNARIYGNARISGSAWVYDNARVYGDARVYGGCWKYSPLYICGTRFSLSNCKPGYIQIGCYCLTFDEWLEKGEAIADANNFTAEEKTEYRAYIELFKKIGK